jgi:hypothetical protein
MIDKEFESIKDAYARHVSEALCNSHAAKSLCPTVIHDHKVGDTFTYGEELRPTWWRRVFLREKPRTVLKTAVITAIAETGTIICDAPPVQLTKPSWWRRMFLREKPRVVFAEPPKEGEIVIIHSEYKL